MRAPRILAAVYRADDGSLGVPLANLSGNPQTVRLQFASPEAQEPAASQIDEVTSTVQCKIDPLPEAGQLWHIDEHGRQPIGPLAQGDSPLTVALPPYGACVIELDEE